MRTFCGPVECIESAQSSVDRAPQTSAASDVIPNTARTESVENAGGVEDMAQLHFGEFLYRMYIKYLYFSFPVDIGRSEVHEVGESRPHPLFPLIARVNFVG